MRALWSALLFGAVIVIYIMKASVSSPESPNKVQRIGEALAPNTKPPWIDATLDELADKVSLRCEQRLASQLNCLLINVQELKTNQMSFAQH